MPNNAIPISQLPSPTMVLETPEVASIPTMPCKSETYLGTDSDALSDMKYSDCKRR